MMGPCETCSAYLDGACHLIPVAVDGEGNVVWAKTQPTDQCRQYEMREAEAEPAEEPEPEESASDAAPADAVAMAARLGFNVKAETLAAVAKRR